MRRGIPIWLTVRAPLVLLVQAKEGAIEEGSAAWQGMSAGDRARRKRAAEEKNSKLRSPNFFVSQTRLSIRNIPTAMDERALKALFISAVRRSRSVVVDRMVCVMGANAAALGYRTLLSFMQVKERAAKARPLVKQVRIRLDLITLCMLFWILHIADAGLRLSYCHAMHVISTAYRVRCVFFL